MPERLAASRFQRTSSGMNTRTIGRVLQLKNRDGFHQPGYPLLATMKKNRLPQTGRHLVSCLQKREQIPALIQCAGTR